MLHLLDVLASGVHDTKNQLFIAESLISEVESKQQIDLAEVRYAIEAAATRLSQTLSTYHLLRHGSSLSVTPVIVSDLCEEVILAQKHHLAVNNIELEIDCQIDEAWPLDRDLINDALNNAIQNASRFARSRIRLSALHNGEHLCLRVDDDGPGFNTLPPANGTGLLLAQRLATMHCRHDIHGRLQLSNGGVLGGAVFELYIP
jgi:signal transduction histidine kinase